MFEEMGRLPYPRVMDCEKTSQVHFSTLMWSPPRKLELEAVFPNTGGMSVANRQG